MRRLFGGFVLLLMTACSSSSDDNSAGQAGASNAGASNAGASDAGAPNAGASNAGAASGGKSSAGASNAGGPSAGAPSAGAGGAVTAPDTKWINSVGNLLSVVDANPGEVAYLSAEPNSNRVIAAVNKVGLYVTSDAGQTWTHLGSGAGSDAITHGDFALIYDPDHAGVFWESGAYGTFSDGIYTSLDDGVTFKQLGTIGHNDLVSIDFSDPARKTLLAGAHEAAQKLYESTDGGLTWTDIGKNLPAGSSFSSLPLIIDTQTFLLGVAGYGDGTWGVLRSTDGGTTWTSTSTEGPSGWPLRASDGSIYWQLRSEGMIMSSDQGKTWTKGGSGPIQTQTGGPLELPDGRIITLGHDHAVVSADKGMTWQQVGDTLPFTNENCQTYGFTYSAALKTLFINHNNCSGNLIADSIWSSGFDYSKE
ncbi:MAG: hypothetical protein WDO69_08000 [Pseudomonadota bacterium]